MKKNTFIIPIVLATLFFINLVAWLSFDKSPLIWDQSHYFKKAIKFAVYFHSSERPIIPDKAATEFISEMYQNHPLLLYLFSAPFSGYLGFWSFVFSEHNYPYRPFLVPMVTGLFLPIGGYHPDAAVFISSLLFITILSFSVFTIGKHLGGTLAGILAQFICLTSPIVIGSAQITMLDLPLASMVALTYALFFRSNYLKNRKLMILFGCSIGLGMLTKNSYVFFIFPLFIIILAKISKQFYYTHTNNDRVKLSEKVSNLLNSSIISAYLALLICGIYYIPNFFNVISEFGSQNKVSLLEKDAPFYSYKGATYYIHALFNEQLGFFYFVLFIGSLLIMMYRIFKKKSEEPNSELDKNIQLMFLWIFIPLVFFTFFPNNDTRFTIPVVPAIAIIIALGFTCIKNHHLKVIGIFSIIVIGIIQFVYVQWRVGFIPKIQYHYGQFDDNGFGGLIKIISPDNKYCKQFSKEPFPYEEIVEYLKTIGKNPNDPNCYSSLLCVSIFDFPDLTDPIFDRLYKDSLKAKLFHRGISYDFKGVWNLDNWIDKTDIVFVIQQEREKRTSIWDNYCKTELEKFHLNSDKFMLDWSIRLNDQDKLLVYVKKKNG